MNALEARVARFQELCVNPWQNKFNWVLDVLRTTDPLSLATLKKQGSVFQF